MDKLHSLKRCDTSYTSELSKLYAELTEVELDEILDWFLADLDEEIQREKRLKKTISSPDQQNVPTTTCDVSTVALPESSPAWTESCS